MQRRILADTGEAEEMIPIDDDDYCEACELPWDECDCDEDTEADEDE